MKALSDSCSPIYSVMYRKVNFDYIALCLVGNLKIVLTVEYACLYPNNSCFSHAVRRFSLYADC